MSDQLGMGDCGDVVLSLAGDVVLADGGRIGGRIPANDTFDTLNANVFCTYTLPKHISDKNYALLKQINGGHLGKTPT